MFLMEWGSKCLETSDTFQQERNRKNDVEEAMSRWGKMTNTAGWLHTGTTAAVTVCLRPTQD